MLYMFFGLEWLVITNILYPLAAIATIEAADRIEAPSEKKERRRKVRRS